MGIERVALYSISAAILVLTVRAQPCPKFPYLDLAQLKVYPELRLGHIQRFMTRDMSQLVFMSRVIQVFGLLLKGYTKKTTELFDGCFPKDRRLNEAEMTNCFFRASVECLGQEYKADPSYYSTWENSCNPYNLKRTNASETVDWKPVHVHNLDNETVSILFNLAACVQLKKNMSRSCPQPCMTGELCRSEDDKFHVRSLRCWSGKARWNRLVRQIKAKRFDSSVRAFNYTCDCFSHLKWDQDSLSCKDVGQVCDQVTKFPCVGENTIACISKTKSDVKGPDISCACKEGYYGEFCEFQSNACTQIIVSLKAETKDLTSRKGDRSTSVTRVLSIDSNRIYSGNELCNVNMSGESVDSSDHNMCFPELGSRAYQCKCVFPFQEDLALRTPNCIIKRTACDQHLCLRGTCAQSPDEQSEALCLCDADWEGDMCDRPAQQWIPWSDCEPMCGTGRQRTRWREAQTGDDRTAQRRIVQSESCSDRVDYDCPGRNHSWRRRSPYLTGKLKFVEQLLLSMCCGLGSLCLLVFFYINMQIKGLDRSDTQEDLLQYPKVAES